MGVSYKINKKLTKKQGIFCMLYTTNRKFFGDGTQAKAKTYSINHSETMYKK